MSFRPSPSQSVTAAREQAMQQEILAEQAASLGRAGREVEVTLERLKEFDAGDDRSGARIERVEDAANAVWFYFIQRELMGMRDQSEIVKQYRIPGEVLARLGARRAR